MQMPTQHARPRMPVEALRPARMTQELLCGRWLPLAVLQSPSALAVSSPAHRALPTHAGELLLLRHTKDVRLISAPGIVGESVLLNLLPDKAPTLRPVTVRAVSPCLIWELRLADLEHIFQVGLGRLRGSLPALRSSCSASSQGSRRGQCCESWDATQAPRPRKRAAAVACTRSMPDLCSPCPCTYHAYLRGGACVSSAGMHLSWQHLVRVKRSNFMACVRRSSPSCASGWRS